ncbi:MAG: hypothetical protein U0821_14800 [Chloroflexota bacterium]
MTRGAALAAALLLGIALIHPAAGQADPRAFPQTGFRVDNELIWDFYSKHGGEAAIGPPVSRTFLLRGSPTQIFERQALQIVGGVVRTVPILDRDFLPYPTLGGANLPPVNPDIFWTSPPTAGADLRTAMADFVQNTAGDFYDGQPVRFFQTLMEPHTGSREERIQAATEIWGLPASRPTRDPLQTDIIYLRLERGVLRYDSACRCAEPLKLGALLRSVLTRRDLPGDLAAAAADSPLFGQYDPVTGTGPTRPADLPESALANAFVSGSSDGAVASAPAPTATAVATATAIPREPAPATATATKATTVTTARGTTSTTADAASAQATATPAPIKGDPRKLVLKLDEVGKNAKLEEKESDGDARQISYAVRYQRPQTFGNFHSGPVTIYSKAIICRDVETARQIYEAEVKRNPRLPEATARKGGTAEYDVGADAFDVGDEAAGITFCNGDCNANKDIYTHHRAVFRVDRTVGIVYTYGLEDPEGNVKFYNRLFVSYVVGRARPPADPSAQPTGEEPDPGEGGEAPAAE